MEIVTSWMQQGLQQGLQQGSILNAKESVINILETRFGAIPKNLTETVNKTEDITLLKNLRKQAILVNSLEEFKKILT
ncbi:MAG: hypothetical protein HY819_19530 [Acidobacteria bacterium]|nr:hypothetical protein [Acidobacteriota bacterium]